jgi:hypothetical protein
MAYAYLFLVTIGTSAVDASDMSSTLCGHDRIMSDTHSPNMQSLD